MKEFRRARIHQVQKCHGKGCQYLSIKKNEKWLFPSRPARSREWNYILLSRFPNTTNRANILWMKCAMVYQRHWWILCHGRRLSGNPN
jgi:hypothetical protein